MDQLGILVCDGTHLPMGSQRPGGPWKTYQPGGPATGRYPDRTGQILVMVMFLGWTSDGRIRCVHETSGSINNVTVGTRNADGLITAV